MRGKKGKRGPKMEDRQTSRVGTCSEKVEGRLTKSGVLGVKLVRRKTA